ncbi:meiosis-specific protein ASY2-like [Eutrema salsugineum]|uniref:meiosis-specific protein ASY2-like n=1 Tax=Eutrema salsugineum TaxID=72664 RepID=UPI000CED3D24|nr:meiosis-specific protein ASY2-like [Eutrema salsugineum]
MTIERLEEVRAVYGFCCELRSPGPDYRPWRAPDGWVTLYEAWFSMCHLWVPLPRLLTDYADRRGIALSQILQAGIRYMVAALLFGSEVGVNVDWRFFEEMTTVQRNNSIPDRNVNLDTYPEDYFENLQKLRSCGIQKWPDIHRQRVEAAINGITSASWRRENLQRERSIAMAPIQVNAPGFAARLKAKKSKKKDQQASASRSERSDHVQTVQMDAEVVPQHDANLDPVAEGEIETQVAEHDPVLDAQNQEESHQTEEESDKAARSARKKEKEEVAKAKARGKRKEPSAGEEMDGGQASGEEASKRAKVAPSGGDKVKEVDWSFSFEYPESSKPFVNNTDKCAELFGKIRGSTTEVPAGSDAAFKEMASFAFKVFYRELQSHEGPIHALASECRDSIEECPDCRSVAERNATIAQRRVAEDNWQTMKRKAEHLDAGVKELTEKIEAMRLENVDLVKNLQLVNEAKIQAEKSIAIEVACAKHHAQEKIETETTRIWADAAAKYSGHIDRLRTCVAQQEAIEQVNLDLVQARGTLECLDLLKEKEMSETELRAELESSKRDCEQKLENLSLTDLEEDDLPPPYTETPSGGSHYDGAEHREDFDCDAQS